jgi:hypothetical protein
MVEVEEVDLRSLLASIASSSLVLAVIISFVTLYTKLYCSFDCTMPHSEIGKREQKTYQKTNV